VVDEAQDLSVPQLRFLSALATDAPNSLFFVGDLGQRIFQPPFSWKPLGVDVRGRLRTLHIRIFVSTLFFSHDRYNVNPLAMPKRVHDSLRQGASPFWMPNDAKGAGHVQKVPGFMAFRRSFFPCCHCA
jgi:hypothetical protein